MINPNSIPAELRSLPQWLVWRLEEKKDKPGEFDKVPYSARTGYKANTPENWASFDQAWTAYEKSNGRYAGVGFAFSPDNGFVGIDLDSCLEDGTVKSWAMPLLSAWSDTYLEISPSGTGIKGFARGRMARGSYKTVIGTGEGHKDAVEMYAAGRYFAITGNVWPGCPLKISGQQAAIDAAVAFIEERNGQRRAAHTQSEGASTVENCYGIDPFEFGITPGGDNTNAAVDDFLFRVASKMRWFGCSAAVIQAHLVTLNTEICGDDRSGTDLDRITGSAMKGEPGYTSRAVVTSAMPPLVLNYFGKPKPLLINVERMLGGHAAMRGVLAKNEFTLNIEAVQRTPWGFEGQWNEQQDSACAVWLQTLGVEVPSSLVAEGVRLVAALQSYHPVKDYLDNLTWDGIPRISRLFADYFGAEDAPLVAAFSQKWLISAVARIFRPGCQVDHTPVMEGGQGRRKSSGFRALFGEWFSDDLAEIGTKDSQLGTAGVWGIELSELDAVDRRAAETVKAFLSRRVDRFRPPYGRYLTDVPRQCVFCASTNKSDYLKDETGGRRFWPVRLRDGALVDVERIATDRNMLWAEAVGLYRAGEPWWITEQEPELLVQAREAQAQRADFDIWDDAVGVYIEARISEGQTAMTLAEVLTYALQKNTPEHWTPGDKARVSRVLRQRGWLNRQLTRGGKRYWMRDGDKSAPVFRPPDEL